MDSMVGQPVNPGVEANYRVLKSWETTSPEGTVPKRFEPRLNLWKFPWASTPSFLGVLDYFHESDISDEGPSLQFPSADKQFVYANLGINPRFGYRLVTTKAPHARRIVFSVALPSSHDRYDVVLALSYKAQISRPGSHTTLATLAKTGNDWTCIPGSPGRDDSGSRTTRYLFVGGAPKSGTTWAQLLLNAHPDIFCTGEGDFFALVQRFRIREHNEWLPPNTSIDYYTLFANAAAWRALAEFYAAASGCHVIADRSPTNAADYSRILHMWPAAKVIHCRRHPLDVLVSRLHHEINLMNDGVVTEMSEFRKEISELAELLSDKGPKRLPMKKTWVPMFEYVLQEWMRSEAAFAEATKRNPQSVLAIDYESLLVDTPAVVGNMFRFAGVPATEPVIENAVRGSNFTWLTGRASGQEDRASFFRSGTAGEHAQFFSQSLRNWAERLLEQARIPTHA
jgi:hypothetical protein